MEKLYPLLLGTIFEFVDWIAPHVPVTMTIIMMMISVHCYSAYTTTIRALQ